MIIYILTREPFPYGMAATNRIKCYAKALLSQDVCCKVIVYGRNNYNEDVLPEGIIEGIRYEYIGGSVHRLSGKWKATTQSICLYFRLLCYLIHTLRAGDAVLGYNEVFAPLTWILLKIVHLRKAYYISELCELPYGTGAETASSIWLRSYAFKRLFPQYDGIIAISEALAEEARKHCNVSTVIYRIPILVDYDYYNISDQSDLAEYPYIFHAGTLYEQKDGILGMLEAFGIASQKLKIPIHFVLTGDKEKSPHKKEISSIISNYKIENRIHFLGYVSHSNVRDYLSKASLVIINKYPTQQNKYCFSTKLGEYMAAAKPIIITRVGEAMNWLNDGYDSIIIDPQNTKQLSDAIVHAFTDIKKLKEIGCNAQINCKLFFDYHNYGEKLLMMLKEIKKNRKQNGNI